MGDEKKVSLIITGDSSGGERAAQNTAKAVKEMSAYVERAQAEMGGMSAKLNDASLSMAVLNGTASRLDSAMNPGLKNAADHMDHLRDSAHSTHSMLGSMVQMAAIMGTVAGVVEINRQWVDYNRTLETSKLGIAAIVTSMTQVTDANGQALTGQAKFNAAQTVSVAAQKELQSIAMSTVATYEELVEVYQGILAPALSAKMTFQETLEITGLLTNAVKAIGLPIQQIKQEARDLIQGGISAASSSLATALGINDKMVAQWREQGTVFQELKSRLDGFVYASNEFNKTWDGAWSNFKDVSQRALGEGFQPLFDHIRQEMLSLTNGFVNITKDAAGKVVDIQVKPEVKARIHELAVEIKQLAEFVETAVSWGVKLAEPAMYVGIAVGIGKISTAMMTLATSTRTAATSAKLLRGTLVGLALEGGLMLGKSAAEAANLKREAAEIVAMVKGNHDFKRGQQSGVNYNLEGLDGGTLGRIKEQLPGVSSADLARLIANQKLNFSKSFDPAFNETIYRYNFDRKQVEGFLNSNNPYSIKGNPAPAKEDKEVDISDQVYQKYTLALDGLNKQIAESNPYIDKQDKAMEAVYATVGKLSDEMPQYVKSWNAYGEAMEQNIRLSEDLKTAQEEHEDYLKNSAAYQNFFGRMTPDQQKQFDQSAMTSDWQSSKDAENRLMLEKEIEFNAMRAQVGGDSSQQEMLRIQQEEDAWIRSWATQTDSFQVYEERKAQIEAYYSQQRMQVARNETYYKMGLAQQGFGNMATISNAFYQLSGEKSKAALRAYQVTKSGETVISTGSAAMKAYDAMASIPYVGPVLGALAAAAAVAAGAVQLGNIWSVGPDGSGGSLNTSGAAGNPGTSTNPVVTQPVGQQAGPQQQVQIIINNPIGERAWFEKNLPTILKDFSSRNVDVGVQYT